MKNVRVMIVYAGYILILEVYGLQSVFALHMFFRMMNEFIQDWCHIHDSI